MNPGGREAGPVDYDDVWTNVYGDIQESGPVHRHLTRIVGRLLAPLDYRTVLDVGCGPGHNYELLARHRSLTDFSGVDVSGVALESARRRAPGRFWELDIQHAHPPGTWDLVYCSLVLEHVADDVGALEQMRQVTGRHLVVTTIAGDFERYRAWDERMGHVRNYAPGELEKKVEHAGFRVERTVYWGFPFYSPLVRTVQNRSTVGTGQFSVATRVLAGALYLLYFLNSARRGDIVFLVASPA